MGENNCLLDIMIRAGLLSHDEVASARIQSRESSVSEIDWLLKQGRIKPRDLYYAANRLLGNQHSIGRGDSNSGEDDVRRGAQNAGEALSLLIGESHHIKQLKSMIQKIAPTDATVLIHGESGTGKELVARAIHQLSPRSERPFVALNCSAVPSELIESELFGHKKGAFTGAISEHSGVFRAAHRGTLFLDEIEATSVSMQAKLLRAVQLGEVKAIGELVPSNVDVRFVCATNSDLRQLVNRGLFRQDLLFRISVFEIFVAPLRERAEDIPLLVNHFLDRLGGTEHSRAIKIDPAALELLCKYSWPGNVRELQNEVHRALVIAGDSSTISVRCLSEKITKGTASSATVNNFEKKTLKEAVEDLERDLVQQALNESQGKRHVAARILGLSRQGLLNKINKYKISVPK